MTDGDDVAEDPRTLGPERKMPTIFFSPLVSKLSRKKYLRFSRSQLANSLPQIGMSVYFVENSGEAALLSPFVAEDHLPADE